MLLLFLSPIIVNAADCVEENMEYNENTGKQCCEGLEKKLTGTDVRIVGGEPYTSNKYKCIKPAAPQTPPPSGEPAPKIVLPDLQIPIGDFSKFSGPTELEIGGKKYLQIPWIAEYIAAIYNYALGIVGIVAIIMIAIGGTIWLTAGGSPDRVNQAKDYIKGAVIGLFLALGSYLILYEINPGLVKLKPLSIRYLEAAVKESIESAKELKGSVLPCKGYDETKLAQVIDADVLTAAKRAAVDPLIMAAIFQQENRGNAQAKRGPCGEVGVTQLMPDTLDGLGYSCSTKTIQKNASAEEKTSIGQGNGDYGFTCQIPPCGHCAQASSSCVDFFHGTNGKTNSMEYSGKLISQTILPMSGGDIALTFAGYNGGASGVKGKNEQAAEYARSASKYYNNFCQQLGGKQQ